MAVVKWKFIVVILVIMGTALFIRCTPVSQQADLTVTPAQVLFGESAESSSAISTDVSVESLTAEATSTKTPIPSETLVVVLPSELASPVTPEPKSTPTFSPTSTVDLTSRLFMFVSDTGFHYSWLDLTTNHREEAEISNYGIPPDSVGSAATLAFSHFSNQVAFWFRSPGEPGTRWLADIELKEPELIYVDNDEVFTSNDSFPPKDVTINWFPNDKYLVVKSTNPSVPNIFVDTSTNSYQENWLWNCNTVITSPKTSQLALLCANNSERSVMEWDGEIWTNPDISGYNILWEWEDDYMFPLSPSGSIPPWSPDGTKIAFVPLEELNTLEIITNSSEGLSVKFEVDTLFPHTIRWIDDGKILVGGYKVGLFSSSQNLPIDPHIQHLYIDKPHMCGVIF